MSDSEPCQWDPYTLSPGVDQIRHYDELRRRCPVAHSELLGYAVFRHPDVMRILNDPIAFSNAVSVHLSVPNGMDPPQHTDYRRIIEICRPYLGLVVGEYSEWHPLVNRNRLFPEDLDETDPWQFKNVRVV